MNRALPVREAHPTKSLRLLRSFWLNLILPLSLILLRHDGGKLIFFDLCVPLWLIVFLLVGAISYLKRFYRFAGEKLIQIQLLVDQSLLE
jgi:hypothetical protein